jgi:hypothetical protein
VSVGVLSVLALGACGGGSAKNALTRAGYVERGNVVCNDAQNRIGSAGDAAFPEKGQTPSAERVQDFVSKTLGPELKQTYSKLKDLKPPSDDQSRIGDMLDQLKMGVDKVTSDPTVIVSRDNNPFQRFDELANDYGLKTCSEIDGKARALTTGLRS